MTQDVRQRWSYQGSLRQQDPKKIPRIWGEMLRPLRLRAQDFRAREIVVVLVKRQLPTQQGVQDDTQTPHVDLLARILLALQHLGRAIAHGSAEGLQVARLALILAREAKVAELDVLVLVEKDVL